MKHGFERYCKDYEKIENYEKAKADNFVGWECHHRLETHTSDGIRKDVDISHKELKALGMYYNRPANELIFLTTREHNAFNKGKHHSEETKKKISEARKGKPKSEETRKKMSEAKKGKKMSEEARRKSSESHKGNSYHLGKHHSEETRKKIGAAKKGMCWYNNGKINIMSKECPEGFVPGMLR